MGDVESGFEDTFKSRVAHFESWEMGGNWAFIKNFPARSHQSISWRVPDVEHDRNWLQGELLQCSALLIDQERGFKECLRLSSFVIVPNPRASFTVLQGVCRDVL